MSAILDKFREQRKFLEGLRFDNSRAPIIATLEMLDGDSETRIILDDLRRRIQIEPLLPTGHGYPSPPRVSNLDEQRALGLFFLEQCKSNIDLPSLAIKYHIRPRYPTSSVQDYVDVLMERFINPFLEYIETKLLEAGDSISTEKTTELFFGKVLNTGFCGEFPETYQAIAKISSFCGTPRADEAWFTVGVMCREALNSYVAELRVKNIIDPSWNFKEGDTKGLLKHLVTGVAASCRFTSTLVALVDSVWDHTQTILHRPSTTKEQALRVFMWTGLSIAEVDSAMRQRS